MPKCRVGQLATAEAPQESFALQARPVAGATRRVGAIARQQHVHVHVVGARLQPGEEAFHPVPDLLRPGAFAFDHPPACLGAELAPRRVEGNALLLREFLEVLLAFGVGLGLPGLDRAAAQRSGLVGNDEPIVDADGATEATAGLARAQRGVERELAGGGRVVRQVAVPAARLARVAPGGETLRRIAGSDDLPAAAAPAGAPLRLL